MKGKQPQQTSAAGAAGCHGSFDARPKRLQRVCKQAGHCASMSGTTRLYSKRYNCKYACACVGTEFVVPGTPTVAWLTKAALFTRRGRTERWAMFHSIVTINCTSTREKHETGADYSN